MRILVGMSHELKRYGCIQLLKDVTSIEYMVSAANTEDFIDSLQKYTFDFIVIDSSLYEETGIQAIVLQLEKQPDAKCVFLLKEPLQLVNDLFFSKVIDGIGYEKADLGELMKFFQQVLEGERISLNWNQKVRVFSEDWKPSNELTKREEEVFYMKIRGFTVKEAAEVLKISEKTVENHRRNIRKKLNIKKNSEWVQWGKKLEMI
ncbi:hypothetical protein CR203_00105 [Salipaludibacillus neizhouensis]|uniref:HTH luxR-type domain-containing protein n=1 Tax=Salipaludibacillus neizhouensis TaxID=885475 RepID=A0A3A9K7H3_9BACI|nr:response regulator transcription factor [Salipaludibacillus neizhouensis]RKL68497.1 hypothetical protein CR203_00105 [Salipaludibacillus neizhouensis]